MFATVRGARMNPDYRKKLLRLMARIEQQIAAVESLTVAVLDDEILLGASEQLTELRRVLGETQRKLNSDARA